MSVAWFASMAMDHPIILTDRCNDVIGDLRRNVMLKGLEKRIKVSRLALGERGWRSGASRRDKGTLVIQGECVMGLIIVSLIYGSTVSA